MKAFKNIKIPVIIVLIIAIVSLGVAFAAFNSTLIINGTASVDEVTWDIVFEGLTTENVLDSPVVVGSASVVTAPTIKNNSTDISTYSVTLSAPGDSITYNFKIHNKGTIAARVTNLDIQSGVNLTTDTAKRTSALNTLNNIDYKIYYTEGNAIIGNDLEKDCLAPGEEELVSLRIIFLPSDDESVLPSTDLLLDNLGVTITYQSETSCAADSGGGNSGGGNGGGGNAFQNIDGAYYTYQNKSFIGTGVNRVILSTNIISDSEYYEEIEGLPVNFIIDNGAGANPRYLYWSKPTAQEVAENYCTGCRLMTYAEAYAWDSTAGDSDSSKRVGTYNGSDRDWLLADYSSDEYWGVDSNGGINNYSYSGVRPAVSISNGATMAGSGTQADPYEINGGADMPTIAQWYKYNKVSNAQFVNYDGAFYTYQNKLFRGTGVNRVIISADPVGNAAYSTDENPTDNGAGATPRWSYSDHPAADLAAAYCTGCRLMTYEEAYAWDSAAGYGNRSDKRMYYNTNNYSGWWLADECQTDQSDPYIGDIGSEGELFCSTYYPDISYVDVRAATDVPSGATMTGNGTYYSPYVVSTN